MSWTISWNQKEGGGDGAMSQGPARVRIWMIMKKRIWQQLVFLGKVNPVQTRVQTGGAGEFMNCIWTQHVLFQSLDRRRWLCVCFSFRYGTVLDFSRPKVKEDAPLNLNKATAYEEPSRTASAKQHYLKQSRYLPGNVLNAIYPEFGTFGSKWLIGSKWKLICLSVVYYVLFTCCFASFKASAQRRTRLQMPVKTTAEAIFGAIVVFHLAGLCQAEVLMVTLRWAHRGTELLCFYLLTAACFQCQVQIRSQVDTWRRFIRRTVLPATGDIRVLRWNQ